MYPTFDWSVAPGHHGYQRACDLISGKASRRPNGSPVFADAGKTEPPSRFILSRTSAGSSQFFMQTKRLTPWPALPRSFGHWLERSTQSGPVCWRALSQGHCGAAVPAKYVPLHRVRERLVSQRSRTLAHAAPSSAA